MSLILKAWTSWQYASISATRRNRERRIKAGDSSPPVDANYVMQSIQFASTLDGDFRRFAEMVGGRHAETYFTRCLQYTALHGAMKGEIAARPEEYGRHVLSTLWDEVCLHQGVIVHDALILSGLAVSPDKPHTYTDPFTCADHVTCTCADHDPFTCAHPLLLSHSLSSSGAGAPPPAPAEEEERRRARSHLGPVSPQPRVGERSPPNPYSQIMGWLFKATGTLRGPLQRARDDLVKVPAHQRGAAWFDKVAEFLPEKTGADLLEVVERATAAIASGERSRREEEETEGAVGEEAGPSEEAA